jgi:hypothetical protein
MATFQELKLQQTGNGSGSRLYGKTRIAQAINANCITDQLLAEYSINRQEAEELDSYVATKWFCMFFIPLIPLKSYLIVTKDKDKSIDTGLLGKYSFYSVISLSKIFWKQVFKTWASFLGIVLALVALGVIMYYSPVVIFVFNIFL